MQVLFLLLLIMSGAPAAQVHEVYYHIRAACRR